MTAQKLTCFFTLQSPWSYLGHEAFLDLARMHEATVVWKPMNLAQVFPESGGLPLAKRHPRRQAYRDIELQRWRETRGLPLNLKPAYWPLATTLADRCIVALVASGADPATFVTQAFRTIWAEDGNLADAAVVGSLLDRTGHDASAILPQADSAATNATYEANAAEALEAGVFGAPTYIRDSEPFWGQDRLPLLGEALASGRPPFTPLPTQG